MERTAQLHSWSNVRGWVLLLVSGALMASIYARLPGAGSVSPWLYLSIHLLGFVGLVAGVALNKPSRVLPWMLLIAGHIPYLIGDFLFYPATVNWGWDYGYPSLADYLFVAGYLLIVSGFVAMLLMHLKRDNRRSMVDLVIFILGIAVLAWELTVESSVEGSAYSLHELVFVMAYPTVDVLLVGVLMMLLFLPLKRSAAFWFLTATVSLQLFSDIEYLREVSLGIFNYDTLSLVLYTGSFVAIGVTALHPSMTDLTEPRVGSQERLLGDRGLMVLLTFSTAIPLWAIFRHGTNGDHPEVRALTLLSAVMFGLVLFRMWNLLKDIARYRQVEQAKNEFLSIVSHELRTPLTSIRGALGLLRGGMTGELDPQARRMIDIAESNTVRVIRLVNDILDFEKMRSGKLDLVPGWIDARSVVEDSLDALRSFAFETQVEMVLVEGPPCQIYGDKDRIEQTVINLISNALKFSEPRSRVEIGYSLGRDGARFFVKDHGRGIPDEKLKEIFGKFTQVDATDSRQKGGSGLGLSISKWIVEQHGGELWATSVLGQGSTFYFTIPEALPVYGARSAPAGRGPLVLICDDDPSVREIVGATLQESGYRVLTAGSGSEALQLATEFRPAAVLLDLLMPGMDGVETALELQNNPTTAEIPVIVISAVPRDQALAPDNIVHWIEKPFSEDELNQALSMTLHEGKRVLVVEGEDEPVAITELSTRLVQLATDGSSRPVGG